MMAIFALNYVRDLWPFSYLRSDDLRVSDRLVKNLAIPEDTKRFVFAIQDPQTRAVVYVLCVQNLSESSALDAECLIRAVEPDAVVAQIGPAINGDDELNADGSVHVSTSSSWKSKIIRVDEAPMPTSPFEVVKRCFVYRYNKEKYEDVAGKLVLKEIFGVGFNGHFLSAKRAAKEVGASFLLLDSPFVKCHGDGACSLEIKRMAEEEEAGNKFGVLDLIVQQSTLVPQRGISMVPRWRFPALNDVQVQMVKSIGLRLFDSGSFQKLSSNDIDDPPRDDYEAPHFSLSIYPLLVDLHDLFTGIPHMGRALAYTQKMLCDINKGEVVEAKLLSEVYVFRNAVEALRTALNNASRLPVNKLGHSSSEFSVLSIEDKSHALTAQAVRSQTSRFKTIVALVDANGLAGLRRHWNTHIPSEVKDMVEQLVTSGDNDERIDQCGSKLLPSAKQGVAFGAGATAVLGAASLSNFVQAYTLAKISSLKLPASIKLLMTQTSKIVGFTAGKTIGTSAVMAPGGGVSGAKISALKAATSAEKIRAVAHNVIASVERTSLSAVRTAFYQIMRRRNQPIGFLPWAAFGSSIAVCSGLFMYGDGIECAVESVPAARSIASLGRGIQNLHQASQSFWLAENSRIQRSVESWHHNRSRKFSSD